MEGKRDVRFRTIERDSSAFGSLARRKAPAPGLSGCWPLLVLALGMLLGYALGWVSFGLPWGSPDQRATLYDEQQVVEVFDRASPGRGRDHRRPFYREPAALPDQRLRLPGLTTTATSSPITTSSAGSDRITVEFP